MIRRVSTFLLAAGVVAPGAVTHSDAASVRSIILAEVDPGGANGTVVRFHDELTPEEQVAFGVSYGGGRGYFVSPVATVTRTAGGTSYSTTTRIVIVPINGGAVVVPLTVTCSQSGCRSGGATTGCTPTTAGGVAACSSPACSGRDDAPNASCSKTESTEKTTFLVFGSV